MVELRINPRERRVLTAIIEQYTATGEPVASQTVAQLLARQEGLSSATIRNVMASLAEAGLLEQPHASAGRVPTAAAYRIYVEELTRPGGQIARTGTQLPSASLPLSDARRGQIDESYHGVASGQEYLERTSHVLALISSGLGVALASPTAGQILEHIHFSRLAVGRVLAVLVTREGTVQDRVLQVDRDLSLLELETASRYLNENFRGWQVDRIRPELGRRIEVEREAYQQLLGSIDELCRKGALAPAETAPPIFVEGISNLITAEADRERLHQMLVALEAKERLVELLEAYVDGSQQGVRVVVGLNDTRNEALQSEAMQDLVLIGAPARLGPNSTGAVALIAPTRIQYQEMIEAVRYIARLSERLLESPKG